MKKHRLKVMAMSAMLTAGAFAGAAMAADVDTVLKEGAQKVAAQKASQKRIDKIADETYDLLQQYKTVNKQIEGLNVYNAQLDRQITNQKQTMADLQDSIENATQMERQIMPLTARMLDGLEDFVKLDLPFQRKSRLEAIDEVRKNLDSSRFSAAEKFRQVLELYDIEGQYSRTVDYFKGTAEVEGKNRQVNFFRVGRIALLYQTPDQKHTGVWDQKSKSWKEADDYRSAVAKGIRIAKKQAAIDLLTLPIPAPEAAE